MRSNELRIGNWLTGPEGKAQVTCIQNREVVEIGEIGHVMEEVSPIPLTEDWLIRLGFERDSEGDFELYLNSDPEHHIVFHADSDDVKTLALGFKCLLNSGTLYDGWRHWIVREIKHVHQLQNLYFALTSEELTIKE